MKKKLYLFLIIVFILAINSCKKEKEGPAITSFLLLPNDTTSFVPGVYNKFSFAVTSDEGINSYAVAIIPKKGNSDQNCYITTHKSLNLERQYSLIDSIWMPDICSTGEYTFQLAFTNKSGYSSEKIKSLVIEYQPDNPLSIAVSAKPSSSAVFKNGDTINVSAIFTDANFSLSKVEVLIQVQQKVQLGYEDAIVMLTRDNFSELSTQEVNASIIVGAENDNNVPPSSIQNWDLQDVFVVLRAYNAEGYVKYSDHYRFQVNDTLQ